MKYLLTFLLFASVTFCFGQKITGIVTDKTTKRPLAGAFVSVGLLKTVTDSYGTFEIMANGTDSLKIVRLGYRTFLMAIDKADITVHIELEHAAISLDVVTIYGDKNFKKDSVNNRLEFEKQFNYKQPRLIDAFNTNAIKQPCELISINPFTLLAVLTKKSSPEYEFNKILIEDEQEDYVSQKFNKGTVFKITGMKGDTLSEFLTRYRPSYQFAVKATAYDMQIYIKESFVKFQKEGFPCNSPISTANKSRGVVKR
jgi:hypothetical protein